MLCSFRVKTSQLKKNTSLGEAASRHLAGKHSGLTVGPSCPGGEEEEKGSGPSVGLTPEAKGSESAMLLLLFLEAKGSLPPARVRLEAKGSEPAALLGGEPKGSGWTGPAVPPKGSAEGCLKKASAPKGSVPLKGSPPKGSERR